MSFSEMLSSISNQYQWDDNFHRKIGFDLFSSEMLGKQINLEKKKNGFWEKASNDFGQDRQNLKGHSDKEENQNVTIPFIRQY